MRVNESLNDIVVNSLLNLWNYIKVKIFKRFSGNCEPNKLKMNLVFEDTFKTFDKSVWRIGQPWGLFHPDYPYQHYGESSVYVKDNHLILDQKYKPATLTWENTKTYHIPYSVGLITSYKSYGYGYYEFEVQLPKGKGLWPAVWLSCDVSWPPEIDINESYSDENGSYKGKLETNFHFNFNENKDSSGARSHIVYDDSSKIKMSCWWTKDFIKIYYNGHLVRQITSDKTLKWFRDKNMIIILNNAIRPEYSDKIGKQISKFHIYSVRVWQ
jgi:beta-glucanase (GH16 family)